MASLPEGWESDYDGARWFFRYKPTGTIQYHFPKPGDEFPEFHDNFGFIQQSYEPIPEELLESERQIRCQTATGVPASGSSSVKRRKDSSAASATLGGGDFFGTSFELFGYYGPGSYNDMNPEHEDWEDEAGSKQDSRPGALTDGELHGTSISNMGTPSSVFSGVTSEAVEVLPVPSTAAAVEVHELPDSAALGGLHYASDPVGYVSELASDMTALCMEASNPPPVELPVYEVYSLGADPAASHSMPVELPNDPILSSVPSIPSPVQSIPQPVEPPQTHVEPLVSASFASQTSTQQAQQQQKPAQDTSAKSYRAFCASTVSSEEDSARRFSVTSGIENIERGFNKEKLHEEYRVVGPTKKLTDVPLALQPPQKSPIKLMESSQDSSESGLADPATLEVAAVTSAPVQHKRPGEQPGYLSDVPSALRPAQGRLISPPAAQTSDTDLTTIPAALRPAGIPGPVPAEALVNDGQNSGTTQPHTHSLLIDSGTLRIPDRAPPIAILDVDEVIASVSSESTEPELIPRPLRLVRQGIPAIPSPETAEAKKVVDFERALELPWTQAQKLQPRRPVSAFGIMSISTAMPAPLKTNSRFPPVPPLFGIMIPTSQPSSLGDAGSSLQPERRASTPATTIATQRRSTPPVMTAPVMALDHPVPSHATQDSHDAVEQCIASSDLAAPLSKSFSSTTSPPVENFTLKTTPPGRTFGRPFTAEAVQPGPDPAQNHPSPPAANMADIPHSDISTQPPQLSLVQLVEMDARPVTATQPPLSIPHHQRPMSVHNAHITEPVSTIKQGQAVSAPQPPARTETAQVVQPLQPTNPAGNRASISSNILSQSCEVTFSDPWQGGLGDLSPPLLPQAGQTSHGSQRIPDPAEIVLNQSAQLPQSPVSVAVLLQDGTSNPGTPSQDAPQQAQQPEQQQTSQQYFPCSQVSQPGNTPHRTHQIVRKPTRMGSTRLTDSELEAQNASQEGQAINFPHRASVSAVSAQPFDSITIATPTHPASQQPEQQQPQQNGQTDAVPVAQFQQHPFKMQTPGQKLPSPLPPQSSQPNFLEMPAQQAAPNQPSHHPQHSQTLPTPANDSIAYLYTPSSNATAPHLVQPVLGQGYTPSTPTPAGSAGAWLAQEPQPTYGMPMYGSPQPGMPYQPPRPLQQQQQAGFQAVTSVPEKRGSGFFSKILNNSAVKKTALTFGSAFVAESLNISGATGAKLGASMYDQYKKQQAAQQAQQSAQQQAHLFSQQFTQHQGAQNPPLHTLQTALEQLQHGIPATSSPVSAFVTTPAISPVGFAPGQPSQAQYQQHLPQQRPPLNHGFSAPPGSAAQITVHPSGYTMAHPVQGQHQRPPGQQYASIPQTGPVSASSVAGNNNGYVGSESASSGQTQFALNALNEVAHYAHHHTDSVTSGQQQHPGLSNYFSSPGQPSQQQQQQPGLIDWISWAGQPDQPNQPYQPNQVYDPGFKQSGLTQQDNTQVDITQVDFTQVNIIQPDATQVDATQMDFTQVDYSQNAMGFDTSDMVSIDTVSVDTMSVTDTSGWTDSVNYSGDDWGGDDSFAY